MQAGAGALCTRVVLWTLRMEFWKQAEKKKVLKISYYLFTTVLLKIRQNPQITK